MAYYTEQSPSIAEYFSWINNTNEGSTEKQTLANLAFFKWLRDETGAQFDIYAFDAGNIDGAAGTYGSTDSERFKAHFPDGFAKCAEKANELGMRLGVWGGADGFGDTEESKAKRREMIVSLCRDYGFGLFKFDTVCGVLRPEYRQYFTEMIEECRKYVPELVILNHRNDLGGAQKYCTTKLWESAECYIDVLYSNKICAPHHRGGTLMRGNPEGLERLMEDHGVCLSSCLDFWADEMVIQTFCRSLILSPEIYGNPWLLREDELRTMGRLMALKRRFREAMVHGDELPADKFGPNAVSRGDGHVRFVTLRNLEWAKKTFSFNACEATCGCMDNAYVRVIHPYESDLGRLGDITVEVEPWRTCLIMLTDEAVSDIGLAGARLRPMNGPDSPVFRGNVYGLPGEEIRFSLTGDTSKYTKATLGGRDVPELLDGKEIGYTFPGEKVSRGGLKLGALEEAPIPENIEEMYETCVFAADNNALEVRSLERSGDTDIKEIKDARDAFFGQDTFVYRGIWDRFMFDGRRDTFFMASTIEADQRIGGGALRIDAGTIVDADELKLTFLMEKGESLEMLLASAGETCGTFRYLEIAGIENEGEEKCRFVPKTVPEITDIDVSRVTVTFRLGMPARYFRIYGAPVRICDAQLFKAGKPLPRDGYRASNLFAPYFMLPCHIFHTGTVHIDRYPEGAKICVALEGRHGVDAAYALIETPDGKYIGAPDKAPSFPANQFEHFIARTQANNTFYFPIKPEYEGMDIKVHVMGMRNGFGLFKASVYVAEGDTLPFIAELVLE